MMKVLGRKGSMVQLQNSSSMIGVVNYTYIDKEDRVWVDEQLKKIRAIKNAK